MDMECEKNKRGEGGVGKGKRTYCAFSTPGNFQRTCLFELYALWSLFLRGVVDLLGTLALYTIA